MKKNNKSSHKSVKPGPVRVYSRVTDEQAAEVEKLLETDLSAEAHDLVLALEEKYPQDERMLFMLVSTSMASGDHLAMERAAVQLYKLHPRDPMIMLTLGSAYLNSVRPALALRTAETFLKLWPDREESTDIRLQVEELRLLVEEALEESKLDNIEQQLAHEECDSLLSLGDASSARRCVISILGRYPKCAILQNDLALTYIIEDQYKAAVDPLMKVLELEPENILALSHLVKAHRYLGNRSTAVEYAVRMKSIQGDAAQPRLLVAMSLVWVGDYDGILEVADREALEDEPDEAKALITHFQAVAVARSGDEPQARELWLDALALDPELHIAQANLDDIDLPVSDRYGPTPLAGEDIMPIDLFNVLKATAMQTELSSPEVTSRAYRKVIRQHPELVTVANIAFEIGDPISVGAILLAAYQSLDPALLEQARQFALSNRGCDEWRLETIQLLHETGVLGDGPVKFWLNGEWTEIDPDDIETYMEEYADTDEDGDDDNLDE